MEYRTTNKLYTVRRQGIWYAWTIAKTCDSNSPQYTRLDSIFVDSANSRTSTTYDSQTKSLQLIIEHLNPCHSIFWIPNNALRDKTSNFKWIAQKIFGCLVSLVDLYKSDSMRAEMSTSFLLVISLNARRIACLQA